MSSSVDVRNTFGALLLGALFACTLSGVVAIQCWNYFQTYIKDEVRLKTLVAAVWILDLCHSAFIYSLIWNYLIDHYGDSAYIDEIPWSVPLTIILTAILTFLVHLFFAQRLYKLSGAKWWIAGPIVLLALLRLASACVTGSEMLRLGTFTDFQRDFKWVFTLGLATSSVVDVLISGLLCYFLKTTRTGSASLNKVMDTLLLYSVQNGSITCASTIVSMICFVTMPTNRIFLGLHFVISKLYANSILATLNSRRRLRHVRMNIDSRGLPVIFSDDLSPRESPEAHQSSHERHGPRMDSRILSKITTDGYAMSDYSVSQHTPRVEISVVKTVEAYVDSDAVSPASTSSHHTGMAV